MAELLRLGAEACHEPLGPETAAPHTLCLDVADCRMRVEWDPVRTRLCLTGLSRLRPH
jgi:hypothetical protein